MSRLSLLFVIVTCFLALVSAELKWNDPLTFCPPANQRLCHKDKRPYCSKYDDGSMKFSWGGGNCPPCGEHIVGWIKGGCPTEK